MTTFVASPLQAPTGCALVDADGRVWIRWFDGDLLDLSGACPGWVTEPEAELLVALDLLAGPFQVIAVADRDRLLRAARATTDLRAKKVLGLVRSRHRCRELAVQLGRESIDGDFGLRNLAGHA